MPGRLFLTSPITDVAAFLGAAMGGFFQWLGDVGVQRRIEHDLRTVHQAAIRRILAGGQGVLIVIRMQEWETADFNGMRARGYLGINVHGLGRPPLGDPDEFAPDDLVTHVYVPVK